MASTKLNCPRVLDDVLRLTVFGVSVQPEQGGWPGAFALATALSSENPSFTRRHEMIDWTLYFANASENYIMAISHGEMGLDD